MPPSCFLSHIADRNISTSCTNEPYYRGTSLTRKRNPLGPYRRPMPRVLGGTWRGGRFLMGEVPLYSIASHERIGQRKLLHGWITVKHHNSVLPFLASRGCWGVTKRPCPQCTCQGAPSSRAGLPSNAIPSLFVESLFRSWSHFVDIHDQILTKSSKIDFWFRFEGPCVGSTMEATQGQILHQFPTDAHPGGSS